MTKPYSSQLRESHADRTSRGKLIGLVFVFLWFLIGGVAHFVLTDLEMRIVPPYVRWPYAAVLITGAFELIGAAALLWRPTRRAASYGLFILTILVTPANIYMLQQPQLFDVPVWMLIVRLPLQVALLVLIAWSGSLPSPFTTAKNEG